MKRTLTAVLVAVLLAGCGSDDDGADDGEQRGPTTAETAAPRPETALFDSAEIGFTFRYPRDLVRERARGALGQVSLERGSFFNAVKVREAADRELDLERYLDDFRRDFARRVGKVEKRVETIEDLEVGVLEFEDSHQGKGERIEFSSVSYFFKGAGRTWQVECVAETENRGEIATACRTALESIEFKDR